MKKKLSAIFVTLFMVLALFCGSFFAAKESLVSVITEDVSVSDENTTKNDEDVQVNASGKWVDYTEDKNPSYKDTSTYGYNTVSIWNEQQMAQFSKLVNNDTYYEANGSKYYWRNLNVYLETDLDMSAHYWTPIGTLNNPFKGNFYGQGYTISGLKIDTSSAVAWNMGFKIAFAGFFGQTDGCTIEGLNLNDVYYSVSQYSDSSIKLAIMGGMVAGYGGSCTIRSCAVSGELRAVGELQIAAIGGLTGDVKTQTIRYSVNYTKIYISSAVQQVSVGGIIAAADGIVIIEQCANLGTFSTFYHTDSGDREGIGGIAGAVSGTTTIEDCVNYASITCSSSNKTSRKIGGILGYGENDVTIDNCVNYGDITGSSNKEYIGGIVGKLGRNGWGYWENPFYYNSGASWENNYILYCITYGNVAGAGNNKIGALVGSYKGYLYGNYTKSSDRWGEWLNDPSGGNYLQYCDYWNLKTLSYKDFFVSSSSYASGGTHKYGKASTVNGVSFHGWYSPGSSLYSIPDKWYVKEGEVRESGVFAITPLVKNYFDHHSISYSNICEDYGYSLIPGVLLDYFTVKAQWRRTSSYSYQDSDSTEIASVTNKGYGARSGINAYVYFLRGARYGTSSHYSSEALYSVSYDSTLFTLDSINVSGGNITKNSTSGTYVDFTNYSTPSSYYYSYHDGTIINYKFTAKSNTLTYEHVCGSTTLSRCSVSRSRSNWYYRDTFEGTTVTPEMGYYLKKVQVVQGSDTITLIENENQGTVTISGTSWYFKCGVTKVQFIYEMVNYTCTVQLKSESQVGTKNKLKDENLGTWKVQGGTFNFAAAVGEEKGYGYQYSIVGYQLVLGNGMGTAPSINQTYNCSNLTIGNSGYATRNVSRQMIVSFTTTNVMSNIYSVATINDNYLKANAIIFVFKRVPLSYTLSSKIYVDNAQVTDGRGAKVDVNSSVTFDGETGLGAENNCAIYAGYTLGYTTGSSTKKIVAVYTFKGNSTKSITISTLASLHENANMSQLYDLYISNLSGSESFKEISKIDFRTDLTLGSYTLKVNKDYSVVKVNGTSVKASGDVATQVSVKYFEKVDLTLPTNNYYMSCKTTINGTAGTTKLASVGKDYSFVVDPNIALVTELEFGEYVLSYNRIGSAVTPKNGNVYEVSSYQNLIWLGLQVENGTKFQNCIIRQTADIVIPSNISFMPIGNNSNAFMGIYDGQNHYISGLKAIKEEGGVDISARSYVGLFGNVDGATIKNLTIKDSEFTGYAHVGIFAGNATNSTFFNLNAYNCDLNISKLYIYDIYGDEVTGKTIEYVRKTSEAPYNNQKPIELRTLNSCTCNVYDEARNSIGGIIGSVTGSNFTGVSYRSDITKESDAGVDVYVFAGKFENSTLDQCYAEGTMTGVGTTANVQGFISLVGTNVLTDYYYINGTELVRKQKTNADKWTTINGKEVLKIFYWY